MLHSSSQQTNKRLIPIASFTTISGSVEPEINQRVQDMDNGRDSALGNDMVSCIFDLSTR